MKRMLVLGVLATVVFGLARWDDPGFVAPSLGARTDANPGGSVWYCAAGATEGVVHQIAIANLGAARLRARLTGYNESPAATPPVSIVDVAAGSRAVVVVSEALPGASSVAVELVGGPGSVEHRISSNRASDLARCSQNGSQTAFFPAIDTAREDESGSVPPASARVWLFNPFPTDASVDLLVAQEDGARIPPSLRGIVIPGGSVRSVELGENALQLRNQGSLTVLARAGRIVAELVQTGGGVGGGEGLRMQPGIAEPSTSWLFADGFAGAGTTERYVVLNPGDEAVTVELAVTVAGDAAFQPEPFVRDIPARRFTVFDLHQEARLPETGLRWVSVTSSGERGVAVARVAALSESGGDGAVLGRPLVSNGLANSTGSTVTATKWGLAGVGLDDGQQAIVVANPDPESIAVVTVSVLIEGASTRVGDPVEVPPGSSFAVDVTSAAGVGGSAVVVESSTPVSVELRSSSTSLVDLSVSAATPLGGIGAFDAKADSGQG